METIQLIVNGETKGSVQCEHAQLEAVKKVLSQLGIYAGFHGYNFQYWHEPINNQ